MPCVDVILGNVQREIEQHLRLNECFKEQRLILHNLAACKTLASSRIASLWASGGPKRESDGFNQADFTTKAQGCRFALETLGHDLEIGNTVLHNCSECKMAAPDEETPFAGPPVDKNYHGKGKFAVLVVLALGLVGALVYTTAHVGTSTATDLNSVYGPYDGCYMDTKWTCPADRICSTPDEPRGFNLPGCFACCRDNKRAWDDVFGDPFICQEEDCTAAYNKCQDYCTDACTDASLSCDCGIDDIWCRLG